MTLTDAEIADQAMRNLDSDDFGSFDVIVEAARLAREQAAKIIEEAERPLPPRSELAAAIRAGGQS